MPEHEFFDKTNLVDTCDAGWLDVMYSDCRRSISFFCDDRRIEETRPSLASQANPDLIPCPTLSSIALMRVCH